MLLYQIPKEPFLVAEELAWFFRVTGAAVGTVTVGGIFFNYLTFVDLRGRCVSCFGNYIRFFCQGNI